MLLPEVPISTELAIHVEVFFLVACVYDYDARYHYSSQYYGQTVIRAVVIKFSE